MFRCIAFAFGMLGVLLPLSAAAEMPVPAGVNLHNGYIVIINHVQGHDGFMGPATVNVNRKHEGEVPLGGTLIVNRCCILAGSSYEVELNYMSHAGSRVLTHVTRGCATFEESPSAMQSSNSPERLGRR